MLSGILALALVAAVAVWASPWTYRAAMRRAEALDAAWAADHPDCTWDEAHAHRERVRRWFLRA